MDQTIASVMACVIICVVLAVASFVIIYKVIKSEQRIHHKNDKTCYSYENLENKPTIDNTEKKKWPKRKK